jgi:probable F420-dependent oxidoreductase
MQYGVIYPQTDHPTDPVAIRDYVQAVEGMGFRHLVAYEHVLGANPDRPGDWKGPYTYMSSFMEPFLLFSFMVAHTTRLGFMTGILVLPQRQTVLVAKQAATFDVLSGGRFRLGVGIGWNEVEYVGLGEDFHTRGRKFVEQVEVLRQLWTKPLVTFHGRWHHIDDAGLNPLPRQRPIPLWFGGHHERVLKRAARLADGWAPSYRTAADARASLDKLNVYLEAAGRTRAQVGLEVRLPYGDGQPDVWVQRVAEWQAAGTTHVDFNTLGAGFTTTEQHLGALRRFAEAVGVRPPT